MGLIVLRGTVYDGEVNLAGREGSQWLTGGEVGDGDGGK